MSVRRWFWNLAFDRGLPGWVPVSFAARCRWQCWTLAKSEATYPTT